MRCTQSNVCDSTANGVFTGKDLVSIIIELFLFGATDDTWAIYIETSTRAHNNIMWRFLARFLVRFHFRFWLDLMILSWLQLSSHLSKARDVLYVLGSQLFFRTTPIQTIGTYLDPIYATYETYERIPSK